VHVQHLEKNDLMRGEIFLPMRLRHQV